MSNTFRHACRDSMRLCVGGEAGRKEGRRRARIPCISYVPQSLNQNQLHSYCCKGDDDDDDAHGSTPPHTSTQGTMTHMAPEVLLEGRVSKAADVSVGGGSHCRPSPITRVSALITYPVRTTSFFKPPRHATSALIASGMVESPPIPRGSSVRPPWPLPTHTIAHTHPLVHSTGLCLWHPAVGALHRREPLPGHP